MRPTTLFVAQPSEKGEKLEKDSKISKLKRIST